MACAKGLGTLLQPHLLPSILIISHNNSTNSNSSLSILCDRLFNSCYITLSKLYSVLVAATFCHMEISAWHLILGKSCSPTMHVGAQLCNKWRMQELFFDVFTSQANYETVFCVLKVKIQQLRSVVKSTSTVQYLVLYLFFTVSHLILFYIWGK